MIVTSSDELKSEGGTNSKRNLRLDIISSQWAIVAPPMANVMKNANVAKMSLWRGT